MRKQHLFSIMHHAFSGKRVFRCGTGRLSDPEKSCFNLLVLGERFSVHQSIREVLVLRPGFEPGSVAREATILDRTILPEPWKLKFPFLLMLVDY